MNPQPAVPVCCAAVPVRLKPVYLSPKELGWELGLLGIPSFDERKCRLLARQLLASQSGAVIRKTYCRLDLAVEWLLVHADWQPYSKLPSARRARDSKARTI